MKKFIKLVILLFAITPVILFSGCVGDEVKIVSISIVEDTIPSSIYSDEIDQKLNSIKIEVVKSDDSSEQIAFSKSMISDSDYNSLSTPGTYNITVSYEGFETTLNLIIKNRPENPDPVDPEDLEYSVVIKDIAGKPLSDFYVTFYQGKEIVAEGYTRENGTFTAMLSPNMYDVEVEGREGYYLNAELFKTDLLATPIEITCELDSLEGVEAELDNKYAIGDIMYDFTLVDTDNKTLKLYELLKQYKVVILNFWFTTCTYCYQEFPAMVEAYESTYVNSKNETINYKDEVAIIAVNPMVAGNGDTLQAITSFKETNGISFNVAPDYDFDTTNLTMDPALTTMFGITGYPTTVIIDSFGLIAQIEEGGQTSPDKWMQTFDKYVSDDYFPVYTGTVNGGVEVEKPDIVQADSSELEKVANGTNYNGEKFQCTYRPEEGENDKEYSWPWVVTQFRGVDCLKPSNQDRHPSFSIVYFDVDLKKGEGLAFDYFASSEDYDVLYVTFNGSIVAELSGQSKDWTTQYLYVALEDDTFEVGLCYLKDSSYNGGEDSVFVRNVRIVKEEDIDKETYIFRECAEGEMNEMTMSYNSYVEVVYNTEDGYYHVNNANGPLLLADMLSGTKWNNSDLYSICIEGKCIGADGVDYNDIIEEYSVYASNSTVGYTPVTSELAKALKEVARALGDEAAKDNPNQWLELCVYYSAYGTNGIELGLPTIGVCYFEPIFFEGDGIDAPATSEGVFDRIILPRGLIFGFTPTKSGVYKFYGIGDLETSGWVCDEKAVAINGSYDELRSIFIQMSKGEKVNPNFECFSYLEAGKTYLFRAGFYDSSYFGTIEVEMKYMGDKLELLTLASPGFFTSSDGEMVDIISGNYVDVELGDDGYYHVKNSLATDDLVYCDIEYINNIIGVSLKVAAGEKHDAFNFNKDEYGQPIYDEEGYYRVTVLDDNLDLVRYYVCVDANGEEHYVSSVGEGEYTEENGYTYVRRTDEMQNADLTAYVQQYFEDNMITDETSELYGCVKVDEKFASALWLFMNKYTFAGIEGSWLKLCYYYDYIGPISE